MYETFQVKPTLAASFTLTTLVSGYAVDKLLQPVTVIIIGFMLLLVSFTFLGPVPYIPLAPNLWITIASMMLQGAGSACVTLASFTSCLQSTYKKNGSSPSLSTTSKVSGIWTGAYSLGHFLGPTLTGVV